MGILSFLDVLISILGFITLGYQGLYILIGFFAKLKPFPDAPQDKHYAVLISARNEKQVIGNLINSIHSQTYPQELIDIWLVADNCTDNTADLCRSMGCNVIERFNKEKIGKGYALSYLLSSMLASGAHKKYDAFLVFDADNLLNREYIAEMNKAYQAGYNVLTSYRNSTNIAQNWVSSGAALWFVRESRFVNRTRSALGNSCHVGGTGFLFSRKIMERNGGWKFFLMTEDLEFTIDCILHGDRIGYCSTAMLYDEQPVSFTQSWTQRVRWSKGFLQVFRYYGLSLIKWAIRERDFSAIDLTLMICPFMLISLIRYSLAVIFAALGYLSWYSLLGDVSSYGISIVTAFLGMMALAAVTSLLEHDKIDATNKELFAYCLSFPIYMASYVPIAFVAIFARPQWKPIQHFGNSTLTSDPSKASK